MSIWFGNPILRISQYRANTVIDVLDIEFSQIGEDYLGSPCP